MRENDIPGTQIAVCYFLNYKEDLKVFSTDHASIEKVREMEFRKIFKFRNGPVKAIKYLSLKSLDL